MDTTNKLGKKTLLIALIENDDGDVLMRKKPFGSAPYKETWYIFGCEQIEGKKDEQTLFEYLKNDFGIETKSLVKIGEDHETKQDHDGIVKDFKYIDYSCIYHKGDVKIPKGIEEIKWIPKNKLSEYDIVPPSLKLFKKLGYFK